MAGCPAPAPFVLALAPTGMVPTRALTPHVPLTRDELLRDLEQVLPLGLSLVHLHVRDDEHRPTLEPERYARLIEAVRGLDPELVVCVSLSGRDGATLGQRLAPLDLDGAAKPDLASLTPSSLNFARSASVNAPDTVVALAARMRDRGILPELEVFDLGMANMLGYLRERGLLPGALHANLMLGSPAGAQADPLSFGALLAALPPGTHWCVAGIGRSQPVAAALALASGGGVRIGLEDNLWTDAARSCLATNREQVQWVHRLAELHERPLLPAAALRQHLGLEPGRGRWGVAG